MLCSCSNTQPLSPSLPWRLACEAGSAETAYAYVPLYISMQGPILRCKDSTLAATCAQQEDDNQVSKMQGLASREGPPLRAPVDLDIFSALSSRWPLVRTARGQRSGRPAHTAVWLYSAKVRWLLMRSLPETCAHGRAALRAAFELCSTAITLRDKRA